MKVFIRQLMPPDVFKTLLLDLEDRIRAAAQQVGGNAYHHVIRRDWNRPFRPCVEQWHQVDCRFAHQDAKLVLRDTQVDPQLM